jgi:hypothetical protein
MGKAITFTKQYNNNQKKRKTLLIMQINLSYKQVNYELLSLPFIAETLTTF